MDRLVQMNKERYLAAMRPEVERILGQVAEAVNHAPDGHLIDGSEMQVRDLMGQLRTMAYQKAVQMRIDQTEGAFSPSAGQEGTAQRGQGQIAAERADGQRPHRDAAQTMARGGRGRGHADGSAGGLGGSGGERGGQRDDLPTGNRRGQL